MSPHLAFFNTPHEVPSPNRIFPAAGCSIPGEDAVEAWLAKPALNCLGNYAANVDEPYRLPSSFSVREIPVLSRPVKELRL
jgi:hypothetical protein